VKPYKTPFIYTAPQKIIADSEARFRWLKAGRRFGKTKISLDWLIRQAIANPNETVWGVYPTRQMAEDIAWHELKVMIPKAFVVGSNERSLTMELVNGARIQLKTAENEKALRGRRLAGLVMDEAAYIKEHVYPVILRPMLVDLKAPLFAISTPRHGWFVREWEKANNKQVADSAAFHYSIFDNPHIPVEEIETIKKTYSDDVWRQEYLAETIDFDGQIYTEFREDSIFNPSERFQDFKKWPAVVGIDWGSYDKTGIGWVHWSPEGYAVVTKEHEKGGWDVGRHCEILNMNGSGLNVASGDYVLDQSAFRKPTTDSLSVADQFRQNGFVCQRSQKSLDGGIDLMKRMFRGENGRPWLYVSSNCINFIRAVNAWEHGSHEPDILAGVRYAIAHGVRRRLTKLVEAADVKGYAKEQKPWTPKAGPRPIVPLKLPMTSYPVGEQRWDWDTGVPC